MLDLGLGKILIVGAIALVVIGPERLPTLARTLGTLLGRAKRYVSDVQAEVTRQMQAENHLVNPIKDMQDQWREASSTLHATVSTGLNGLSGRQSPLPDDEATDDAALFNADTWPGPQKPRHTWRTRRARVPEWYRQQTRVRRHAQSGAARVAKYRHKP
jgi:sec-independent protein translocase protein TatB